LASRSSRRTGGERQADSKTFQVFVLQNRFEFEGKNAECKLGRSRNRLKCGARQGVRTTPDPTKNTVVAKALRMRRRGASQDADSALFFNAESAWT
jgi:hypothetical protein